MSLKKNEEIMVFKILKKYTFKYISVIVYMKKNCADNF